MTSLWRRTCEFYHTKKAPHGTRWSSTIPHFSSAFIAAHYASVIHGFIVESESRLHTRTTDICYIFDVGCGCGLLGVQVARELKKLGMRGFCVVLADIDISAALAQIQLSDASTLVSEGLVQVCRLDDSPDPHQATVELLLLPSGAKLKTASRRPLVLLSNYLVDSLPMDIVRVCQGARDEALTPLAADGGDTFAYRALRSPLLFPEESNMQTLFERLLERARREARSAVAALV